MFEGFDAFFVPAVIGVLFLVLLRFASRFAWLMPLYERIEAETSGSTMSDADRSESLGVLRPRWVLYVCIAFCVGALIEDLSKNAAASRHGGRLPGYAMLLESDATLRYRSLLEVNSLEGGADCDVVTPKPLAISLFEAITTTSMPVPRQAHSSGVALRQLTFPVEVGPECTGSRGPVVVPKTLRDQVNDIYYGCKNLVFLEETYVSELVQIEARQTFARTFVCAVYLGSWAVAMRIFVLLCIGGWYSRESLRSSSEKVLKEVYQSLAAAIVVFFTCLILIWAGTISFTSASTNFNLRVFGYCDTLFATPPDAIMAPGTGAAQVPVAE